MSTSMTFMARKNSSSVFILASAMLGISSVYNMLGNRSLDSVCQVTIVQKGPTTNPTHRLIITEMFGNNPLIHSKFILHGLGIHS